MINNTIEAEKEDLKSAVIKRKREEEEKKDKRTKIEEGGIDYVKIRRGKSTSSLEKSLQEKQANTPKQTKQVKAQSKIPTRTPLIAHKQQEKKRLNLDQARKMDENKRINTDKINSTINKVIEDVTQDSVMDTEVVVNNLILEKQPGKNEEVLEGELNGLQLNENQVKEAMGQAQSENGEKWQKILREQEKHGEEDDETNYINRRLARYINSKRSPQEINEELENKYPRKSYGILIFGNGPKKVPNDIHVRVDEIRRCTGVREPTLVQIINLSKEEDGEDLALKIMVDNYEDFLKLNKEWPSNAFVDGVKLEPLPTNLQVIIPNVDPKITISPDNQAIMKLEATYGLTRIERINYAENKPSNKLKATAKTLFDYVNVLKKGIYFNLTGKKHKVTYNAAQLKQCSNWGNLNHRDKECTQKKICFKCGSNDHTIKFCTEQPKCVNCCGKHYCNDEICDKIVEKTLAMNGYMIEILLGEGIISKRTEIMRFKKPDDVVINEIDTKTVNDMIEKIVSNKLIHIDNKFKIHEQEIKTIKQNVTKMGTDMENVKTNISALQNDIQIVKNQMVEMETNINMFMNKLSLHNDVVCIQEAWLTSKAQIDGLIYVQDKRVFYKKATRTSNKGRSSAIINTYLIHDDNSNKNNINFESELETLQTIIDELRSKNMDLLIYGDLNTDISRMCFNTTKLKSFLDENNLELTDLKHVKSHSYTYSMKQQNGVFKKSWIDHIISVKGDINVKKIEILEDKSNLGDHLAINSEYQMHVMDNFPKIFATKPIKRPRINWEKPTEIELYQQKAEKHLAKLEEKFNDLHNETDRKIIKIKLNNIINEMSSALLNAVIKTSNQVKNENAKENKKKKKKKSWWNEEIQKIHDRIVAAYIEYKASNFEKAKRKAFSDAKKDFQRQKRLNRHQKKERPMRKLNEMYKMDRNRFWRTVKNLNKSETKVDMPIVQIKKMYEEVFNIPNEVDGKNAEEANKIVHDFINKNENSVFEVNITPERIKNTINMLKNGTAVGFSDLSNEMFKNNNTDRLCKFISIIFNNIINTKTLPFHFNTSILKPLVKDQNKPTDESNNLRPVAISDTTSNLYETILLQELSKEHLDHPKQFGFKKSSSCQHAVFTLNQAIRISNKIKKRLYVCAIDASKAFDKINRKILWSKLIKMNISPSIVHAIMTYYGSSQIIVSNENEYSDVFNISIGVKQGGPLSPKLLSIYMERLIGDIEKLDVGVEHNGQKINVICFADNILILSHTKRGLQKQLEVVEKYGKEMGIKYNPNKTSLMICNKKCRRSKSNQLEDIWQEELILDGVQIQKVDSVKYLGVEIHDTNRNKTHLDNRIRLDLRSSARLKSMEIWTEHTNPYLKGHLYKTFVRPVLIIKQTEGNIVKNMIGISNRCRTTNLLLAPNIESTEVYSENMKTEFIIRLVGNDYTSHFINEMANEGTILQICDLMGHLFNEEKVTVEEIIGICRVSKYINENLTNSMRKENETVKVIRDIFKEKNRELMLNKLFEAIKF
ncbi:RNA-directed DNA polymerase from mobile element jockey-like [Brachionus plicatilis]|uniref:RNA-directed DNA polymerase from mobile element jockey-like n=1 Tax=Brachionus plicatilis TaxID=10195 RepID=A0A3M7QTR3_BRAPC|nr:RNA-directed DNA polymerase from mobile element jockey-like [Brachionus plicatilis]